MSDNARQPARTYAYWLTADDALAWRQLRNDWSTGEKAFGFALAVLLGALLTVLPENLIGAPYDLRFVAALAIVFTLGYGLFRLLIALNDRRLARRDVPTPRRVRLEDWIDRLDECWDGGRRSVSLPRMGPVIETSGHVFVQGPGATIVIPAAAFANAAEKRAFVVNLEKLADDETEVGFDE